MKKFFILIFLCSLIITAVEVINTLWINSDVSKLNDEIREAQNMKLRTDFEFNRIDDELYKIEDVNPIAGRNKYSIRIQRILIRPYLFLLGLEDSRINDFVTDLTEFREYQQDVDDTVDVSDFLDEVTLSSYNIAEKEKQISHILLLSESVIFADLNTQKGISLQNEFVMLKRSIKKQLNDRISKKEEEIKAMQKRLSAFGRTRWILAIITLISTTIISIASFKKDTKST